MPFYRCTITTSLTADATADRLRGLIGPTPTLRERFAAALGEGPPRPPFIGTLSEGAFKAMRVIGYRNSFRPVIRGTYAMSETGGTRINLLVTLHPAVIVLDLFWCAMVAYMIVSTITYGSTHFNVIGLGMIAVALLMTVAGFYPEAIKAKRDIAHAMQA